MDRSLLKYFWNCGDDGIIQFALLRAHLNSQEKLIIELLLDECLTQEEAAEKANYSARRVQDIYYKAADKLLHIPWVKAYALELKECRH